jgi:hypothetical protein
MKNLVFPALLAGLVLLLSVPASACSATDMMDMAKLMEDSELYETAKSVVENTILPEEGWEKIESVQAATGTIIQEYARMSGQGGYQLTQEEYTRRQELLTKQASTGLTDAELRELDDIERFRNEILVGQNTQMLDETWVRDTFLNAPTSSILKDAAGNIVGYSRGHLGPLDGTSTVRDHAAYHGNQWETGYDEYYKQNLDDWLDENYPTDDPSDFDHAG